MKNLRPLSFALPFADSPLTGSPLHSLGAFYMKKIKLTKGYYAIIDDIDFELINKFKWHLYEHCNNKYAVAHDRSEQGKDKTIRMHRLILNAEKGVVVDHVNHNGLDNRRINIRLCTQSQNAMNGNIRTSVNKSSKYKGVSWNEKRKRFVSYIMLNYKRIYIGRYKNESDAAIAYNNKAIELFGEFAFLNTIL